MSIFGYCRISRKSQSIERQVRNIASAYPEARIVREVFTGTKMSGRKELDKILRIIKDGDTIVFDSASRMSRNAGEAMELYEDLYGRGINLVFLKEPHINTDVFRAAADKQIQVTAAIEDTATAAFIGELVDAINRYTIELAKRQIEIVFLQAQKEVDDLHQRTAEGIMTARLNGKEIGRPRGSSGDTAKAKAAKEKIKKYSEDFDGSLKDGDVIQLVGISRNSFYKYKREIRTEIAGD